MEKSKEISVAVGIVTRSNGDFLVTQRQSHQTLAGYWEFPGGKVEIGETIFQGLQRELEEEVGILVKEAEPFVRVPYTYIDKHICLHAWWVTLFTGEPEPREQQPLRWGSLDMLKTLNFPAANLPIIQMIQWVSSKSNVLGSSRESFSS